MIRRLAPLFLVGCMGATEPRHTEPCKVVSALILIDSTKVPVTPDTLYKQYEKTFYCKIPNV